MTTFRYTAVDSRGQPVSGELAASNADDALGQLNDYGLTLSVVSEGKLSSPPCGGSLAVEDATDLADQVADLTKAGLPLPDGLRAMAEEMPRSRTSRAMRAIAEQVEAGRSLEEAIQSYGGQLPKPVREMIAAGHRSGRLAVVLEQFVELQRARSELSRRLWAALAYPTILLLMLVAVYLVFGTFIVPGLSTLLSDFVGPTPAMTILTLSLFAPGMSGQAVAAGVLVVLLFFLCTTGRPGWAQTVLYGIPIVGPLWRWSRLAEFSRLMELLLDEQVPLPHALRLTAAGLPTPELAAACRKAAERVEAGNSFSDSLAGLSPFPPSLIPLVRWGQHSPRPAEALHAATEMFESRARGQVELLETFVPPVLFLFIVGMAGVVLVGLMLPVTGLIRGLMWW